MGSIWTEVAWTALPPLAVAAAVMAVANLLGFRPRAARALAIGWGYVAGHLIVVGRSVGANGSLTKLVRPHEARDWLPLAVLVAMGVTLLASAAPRTWQRWLVGLAAVVSLAVPVRLLANSALVATRWSTGEKLAHLALLAAAMALTWLLLSTAGDGEQPRLRAILLVMVAVGAAITITRSGSFSYGQLCGVVAAAIAGAGLACVRVAAIGGKPTVGGLSEADDALNRGAESASETPPTPLDQGFAQSNPDPFLGVSGAAGVLTMSLGSLILLAHFYASLKVFDAVLLVAALVAAGGRLPAFLTGGSAWRQGAIRAVVCLAPLIVAAVRRM